METLRGKVAVITGGGSGIGRELALACAREGMRIVLADVDEPGMVETTRLIGAAAESSSARCDVRKAQELDNLAKDPSVVRVVPDVSLNYNDSRVDTAGTGTVSSTQMLQTDMFRIRGILGADSVNSVLNVTGRGVNVAIVDTGTDFGNAELSGAVARDSAGILGWFEVT